MRCLKDTMFPGHYDEETRGQLTKCLRVLPHDQNTSGFFITIIRKIRDFDNSLMPGEDMQPAVDAVIVPEPRPQGGAGALLPLQIQKKSRNCSFEFTRCDPTDPDIEYIKSYYGLGENFPVDQLITQSDDMNKLFFISEQVSHYLYADNGANKNLVIINMGVALFHRNTSRFSSNTECIFRISQDGLLNLIPYMTKRIVYAPTLEVFKYFLMHKNVEIQDVPGESLRQEIDNFSTGCFILAVKLPKGGK